MKYDEVAAHPFLLTAHVAAERVSKFWVGGPRCTPRPGAGARCRRARGHVNTAAHPPASPAGLWPAESAQRLSLSKFCVSRIACGTRTFFWRFHLSVAGCSGEVRDCDAIYLFARRDVTVVTVVHRSLAWTVRQRQMLSANPCMLTVCSLPRMQVSLQCARQHSKRAAR